jgi:hypothetical protein
VSNLLDLRLPRARSASAFVDVVWSRIGTRHCLRSLVVAGLKTRVRQFSNVPRTSRRHRPILRSVKNVGVVLLLMLVLQASPAAEGARDMPRFAGCKSFFSPPVQGVVRPRSIVLACGDGNFYLTGITWSRWGMQEALGIGVGHQNDCLPDCARGRFHSYRVALELDRALQCGVAKLPQFTRAFWAFRAAKPDGVARAGSETFRCRRS